MPVMVSQASPDEDEDPGIWAERLPLAALGGASYDVPREGMHFVDMPPCSHPIVVGGRRKKTNDEEDAATAELRVGPMVGDRPVASAVRRHIGQLRMSSTMAL